MSPGALGTFGRPGLHTCEWGLLENPIQAQPLPRDTLPLQSAALPQNYWCPPHPVDTVSSWTGEGYEQHGAVFLPLRPTTSVSRLSGVLALHHWRKLNSLALLCPPQSSAHCPPPPGLFQTTANIYLTVCLNSFPIAEILSWPVHRDEDTTYLLISKMSSPASPSCDFRGLSNREHLQMNREWLSGPSGPAPLPCETCHHFPHITVYYDSALVSWDSRMPPQRDESFVWYKERGVVGGIKSSYSWNSLRHCNEYIYTRIRAGWAAVHWVARSQTRLSDFTFTFHFQHWRRKWQPTPVFLPGESQGRGSLVGCRLWGRTESDTTEAT